MLNRLSPPGYLLYEQTVSTPQYSNLDTNLSRDYGGSVSVFKSWFGQGTPTFPVSNTYVSGEGSTSNTSNFSHEETDYNTSGSTLLLTMSHGAASDLINELNVSVPVEEPVKVDEKRKSLVGKSQAKEPVETRKSVDSLGQRTSQYRGVTKHRWTGRYEAHLWDNSCKKEGQSRRGRQGGYDDEEKAARAYDLAAMKYWGPTTHLNFPLSNYEKEMEELNNMTRQEFVAMLRRHRWTGRYEAHLWDNSCKKEGQSRRGRQGGYDDEEKAARVYDLAAMKYWGPTTHLNFPLSNYEKEMEELNNMTRQEFVAMLRRYDVKRICSNSTIINSDQAKRSPSNSASGQ
ncbi:hypothetical protein F2Q70_00015990 [Brassica cretica]|uniref:AP2/ERF domain-containing protein n=1 Tax=Brassica cretica TaxID=69181 RepID=A0A8S9HMH5_BRACR|nr:hypothetical protein F2Q70_00015990 [Brassica cretica]